MIAGLITLFGCESAPVYEKTYAFEKKKWEQNVKPVFTIPISDTSKYYDFMLTLRTTTDYKYSNLWIYLNTTTPDGKKGREPFEIIIANPDGTWAGKKTGTIVENTLVFKRRKMPVKGNYTFVIEQGITQQVADQVLDISLIVDQAK